MKDKIIGFKDKIVSFKQTIKMLCRTGPAMVLSNVRDSFYSANFTILYGAESYRLI